jgi:putative membrane protein
MPGPLRGSAKSQTIDGVRAMHQSLAHQLLEDSMKRLLTAAAVLLVPAWALAQSEMNDPQPYPSNQTGSAKTGSERTGSDIEKGTTGSMNKGMTGEETKTLTKSQLLNKLHHVNAMEIEVGQLAQTHARSAKVKQFGETLVKDHTKADKDVMDFAKNNNIVLSEAGIGADKSMGSSYKGSSGTAEEQTGSPSMGTTGSPNTTGEYKSGESNKTGQYNKGETGTTGSTGEQYGMKESHKAKIDRLSNLQGDAFDRAFLTMMVEDHEKVINLLESNKGKENDKKLDTLIDKLLPTLRDHQRTAERLQREVPSAS